jgi:hypothetical protein
MNKSDKELAVELTVATMNMIAHHKMANGQPTYNPLTTEEALNTFKKFHKGLRESDNS